VRQRGVRAQVVAERADAGAGGTAASGVAFQPALDPAQRAAPTSRDAIASRAARASDAGCVGSSVWRSKCVSAVTPDAPETVRKD
jgi:hypothetical protein